MYHYTDHAKDRMRERRITKEEVEYCLEHYEMSYPSKGNEHCMNYIYNSPNGRRIRVAVNIRRANHKIIVSVMD